MFCSQSVCLCLCVYCKDEWMNELASIYYLIYITCYISPPPHPYSEPHNQLLLNWTSNCSCSVSILSINSSLLVMTTIIVVVVIMIIMLVTSSTLYCNHYSFLYLSLMLSLSLYPFSVSCNQVCRNLWICPISIPHFILIHKHFSLYSNPSLVSTGCFLLQCILAHM